MRDDGVRERRPAVEDFHVGRMRHTFACPWCGQGGDGDVLQLILGNAGIEISQRYARLSDEAVTRETSRVNPLGRTHG